MRERQQFFVASVDIPLHNGSSETQEWGMFERLSKRLSFKQGDWVVFCRTKHTTHPGRRARDIHPTANGDNYTYHVEKFWLVLDVLANGQLLLQTRRGKQHVVEPNDPNLRHATWLDRIRYPSRFAPIQPAEHAN